jgi:flavodoxin
MKSLVIYDSAFGNTKQIAEAIAKAINSEAVNVSKVKAEELKSYEFIVVGSPIQGWRPLVPMINFLSALPKDSLKGVKVAAFDTRINIFVHGDAVKKIANGLAAAGSEVIGSEFFYVKDKEGPIKEGEMERAVAWAKSLTGK